MKTTLRSTLSALAAAVALHAGPAFAQVASGEAAPTAAPATTTATPTPPSATTATPAAPAATTPADPIEARLAALEKKAGDGARPATPEVKLGGIVQADARHYLDT